MYTKEQIEGGEGLFTSHAHTTIFQRGEEDVFVTASKNEIPGRGYHVAGQGRLLSDGTPRITWCDLR